MRSLEYLNQTSATQITFTDNRDADVIFDRFPEDVTYEPAGQTFPVVVGLEIVEIIQPQYTNVRFRINMNTNQAQPVWASNIPQELQIVNIGSTWTVYNIDSISDWNAIKQPNIVLDSDYFGDATYTVSIIYDTYTETNKTVSYNVGAFVPVTDMDATFTLSLQPSVFYSPSPSLNAFFNVSQFILDEIIAANFYIECIPNYKPAILASTNLDAQFNIECNNGILFSTVRYIDAITPRENGYFGRDVELINNSYIAAPLGTGDDDAVGIFNISNGNLARTIPRQYTSETLNSEVIANENYLIVKEEATGGVADKGSLYKRQGDSTEYTLIDTIDVGTTSPDIFYSDTEASGMTDNYAIFKDVSYPNAQWQGRVRVYSLDDTTGFTLEQTYTGSADADGSQSPLAFPQYLGHAVAISDDYVCMAENVQTALPGYWDKIYVYNTSALSTLDRTINNNEDVNELLIEGDILWALTDNRLIAWDLTDGSEHFNVAATGLTTGGLARFDSNTMSAGGLFFNTTTPSRIDNHDTGTDSDYIFANGDTLIYTDIYYDDEETNQGRIIIKEID